MVSLSRSPPLICANLWVCADCPCHKEKWQRTHLCGINCLNEAVKRETYMLANLDDIAQKLSGATVFSKLDATNGFHQIPFDEVSSFIDDIYHAILSLLL